jgi:hypothetical protein
MRILLASVILLLATSRAYAMGVYTTYSVVAWNSDGSAVLLEREISSSGTAGTSRAYLLFHMGATAPLVASFTDTQDPDHASEKIDQAACEKAADTLGKALDARHFRGVTLDATHCKRDRAVVRVGKDSAQEAAVSMTAVRDDTMMASTTGKLIVMMTGQNDDGSQPKHIEVRARTATGYTTLFDDTKP